MTFFYAVGLFNTILCSELESSDLGNVLKPLNGRGGEIMAVSLAGKVYVTVRKQ